MTSAPDYVVPIKQVFYYEARNNATGTVRRWKITAGTFRGGMAMLLKNEPYGRTKRSWEHNGRAEWIVINSSVRIFARLWEPSDEVPGYIELWDGHNVTNKRNFGL